MTSHIRQCAMSGQNWNYSLFAFSTAASAFDAFVNVIRKSSERPTNQVPLTRVFSASRKLSFSAGAFHLSYPSGLHRRYTWTFFRDRFVYQNCMMPVGAGAPNLTYTPSELYCCATKLYASSVCE